MASAIRTAAIRTVAAAGRPTGWTGPAVVALVALVGLAIAAYAVNQAIENYHDRIALKGLGGRPSPVNLIVAGEPMVIPANMIRFRNDRRGGAVDRVDLLLHWPTLEGFSEARADAFRDAAPAAPLIFVTIAARENSLDSTARLAAIYRRFFEGPVLPGPGGLVGRDLSADSGYRGERVYFAPRGADPFVARCLAEATPEIPATCIREVNIGQGLSMLYRFNQARLGDWSSLDGGLRRLATTFIRRS